ncbi:hypothetical protein NHX12_027599 [Muraenolepis orangiensis]|uniref:Aquaporin-3 n=1 Tax=Muraenolepis orangiensis TaxID=630683 RepID=A0A9Q0EDX0_9TELE|nr:hypothetical protein NHX12_027599 [Muraenolepis orangiensis]
MGFLSAVLQQSRLPRNPEPSILGSLFRPGTALANPAHFPPPELVKFNLRALTPSWHFKEYGEEGGGGGGGGAWVLEKAALEKLAEIFHVKHPLLRQGLAECLGTLVLVMFGCGAVAQTALSGGAHGTFLTVNLAFGFAATLGILVSGQVSWGHLNPAVTFDLCVLGRYSWRKFPVFFLFQTLGAFLGAGIVCGIVRSPSPLPGALWAYGPGSPFVDGNVTRAIFATNPSEHLTLLNGFFNQER